MVSARVKDVRKQWEPSCCFKYKYMYLYLCMDTNTNTNTLSETRAKSEWEVEAVVATGGGLGWPRARAPKWYAPKLYCHAPKLCYTEVVCTQTLP